MAEWHLHKVKTNREKAEVNFTGSISLDKSDIWLFFSEASRLLKCVTGFLKKDIDALKGHFAQKWKFCQLHTFTQTCMTYDLNIEMVLVVFSIQLWRTETGAFNFQKKTQKHNKKWT